MLTFPKNLTRENLIKMADAHIRRFKNLIEYGGREVREDECRHYLAIWKETKRKAEMFMSEPPYDLDEEELGEVIDAVTSGDYDHLLTKAIA